MSRAAESTPAFGENDLVVSESFGIRSLSLSEKNHGLCFGAVSTLCVGVPDAPSLQGLTGSPPSYAKLGLIGRVGEIISDTKITLMTRPL